MNDTLRETHKPPQMLPGHTARDWFLIGGYPLLFAAFVLLLTGVAVIIGAQALAFAFMIIAISVGVISVIGWIGMLFTEHKETKQGYTTLSFKSSPPRQLWVFDTRTEPPTIIRGPLPARPDEDL